MSVQGFFGIALYPGKTYSQIVSAPFRIAMVSSEKKLSRLTKLNTVIIGLSH
jgi:hypothetical protein